MVQVIKSKLTIELSEGVLEKHTFKRGPNNADEEEETALGKRFKPNPIIVVMSFFL